MKNIIFDLGGVILLDKPISILNNIEVDDTTYNDLKIFFDDWKMLDLGNESLEDKFNKCNLSKENEVKYKNILLNYFKYRKLNENIISLINKLKRNNYNVYILSDNNWECFNYYKEHELFKNLDGWVVSCEYNTSKKDGKLFDILIDKYNLIPEDCYFIDNEINNVKEANKHGIRGYVFNEKDNINYLYDDLKNNNIEI